MFYGIANSSTFENDEKMSSTKKWRQNGTSNKYFHPKGLDEIWSMIDFQFLFLSFFFIFC